ncbi:MAG TPA: ankyrin repeat domain-containing protein [Bryobacteraceae bacterium]|nr:ankyrin repeat domain-containing protein [Bryobacteraceae bacterium]
MPQPDPRFTEIKELVDVCKQGDVERARELLQRHPDVLDSPDRDERFFYPESCLWSPLGLAAWHGHEELVRFLLEAGANPVPFEVAAQYHQHIYGDWTKELRERGYDAAVEAIEAAIYQRYGPPVDEGNIRQAVRDGNVERVRSLIAEKPERVRQVDAVANAALHLAVAGNHLQMVRLLLESGSPPDARNGNGRTPAVIALFGLHRWWRDEEKPEILDLLLKSGAEYTILIAAALGDEARVREILRADRSLANAADPCCRRPLSGAASKGHTNIVRLLLDHGADPNAKEAICQGGYSLHEAAGKGFIEIVQLLLDRGAIPEHWVDSSGDSVFASQRHPNILHLLYSYGGTMELQVYAAAHRIDVIAGFSNSSQQGQTRFCRTAGTTMAVKNSHCTLCNWQFVTARGSRKPRNGISGGPHSSIREFTGCCKSMARIRICRFFALQETCGGGTRTRRDSFVSSRFLLRNAEPM